MRALSIGSLLKRRGPFEDTLRAGLKYRVPVNGVLQASAIRVPPFRKGTIRLHNRALLKGS